MNQLICRDNLEVLCEWYAQGKREFIDLIYIDPPFGNNMDNEWGLKWNRLEDYTNWMYPRVYLMKEMLKPTGSFYYHCDPTASHYVKMMLDMIFGMENFRNEIVWCYTGASATKSRFPEKHDIILFYTKTNKYSFNSDDVRIPYTPTGGGFQYKKWKDNNTTEEEQKKKKEYFMEKGKIVEDYWTDIYILKRTNEKLGYPTQKPEKLLERIILASSNPGDLVADFYLGGGTTIAVAEKLDRNWIGIDINPRAIEISEKRVENLI